MRREASWLEFMGDFWLNQSKLAKKIEFNATAKLAGDH